MRISDWSSDVCSSYLGGRMLFFGGVVLVALDKHAAAAAVGDEPGPLTAAFFVGCGLAAGGSFLAHDHRRAEIAAGLVREDRKRRVEGKRVSGLRELVGRRILKKKNSTNNKR